MRYTSRLSVEGEKPPASAHEQPQGHTMQYATLARALGYAQMLVEDDLAQLAIEGLTISAASLRMEARFVTVTILSAALLESLANTILVTVLAPDEFAKIERKPSDTKWLAAIPSALGCEPFIPAPLEAELKSLFDVRNSIMHPKAKTFTGTTTINAGNAEKWETLDTATVRAFASLPVRISELIPYTPHKTQFYFGHFLDDHWLRQAINRASPETTAQ